MKDRFLSGLIFSLSLVMVLGIAELTLRRVHLSRSYFGSSPLFETVAKPYLYQVRPGVIVADRNAPTNRLGLRGPEISTLKPKNEFRILTLGDSVSFGADLPYTELFATRTAEMLAKNFSRPEKPFSVSSILAAVPGYSAYNELKWFESEAAPLKPDLVVIQFCMNDVVDPWLHWKMFLGDQIETAKIPLEAIPNSARNIASRLKYPLYRFQLYQLFEKAIFRLRSLFYGRSEILTDEDPFISIDVLSDAKTRESIWLRGTYDRLLLTAHKLRVPVVLLIMPLAYQLDLGYPNLQPQSLLLEYAREKRMTAFDATPSLSAIGQNRAFILDRNGYHDIWHLNHDGHEAVAQGLYEVIRPLIAAKLASEKR